MTKEEACTICAIVRDVTLFVTIAILPSYLVYVTI
jgi:hypothetical protein